MLKCTIPMGVALLIMTGAMIAKSMMTSAESMKGINYVI